jgi:hypothetical protein
LRKENPEKFSQSKCGGILAHRFAAQPRTLVCISQARIGFSYKEPGPAVSSTVYSGHQLNIGLTPAVVGQFD